VPYALQANAIKMKTSTSGDTLYTGGGNYLIIPGISAANPIMNQPEAPVTDIDGNVYQTVRIGTQVWMKENLKVSKYRNGNTIPTGLTDSQWGSTTSGAYAIYGNLAANNTTYGKLYNWFAVTDSRGLCPTGWHVPTDTEWYKLENLLDPTINDPNSVGWRGVDIGNKIKAISPLWNGSNAGTTNSSGMSALPGGYRGNNGFFNDISLNFICWSATSKSSNTSWYRSFSCFASTSLRGGGDYGFKVDGFSVRCLKD
jgi:uncharacterized protein (TIGR02145 family)